MLFFSRMAFGSLVNKPHCGLLPGAEDDFFQVHGFPISGVGADGECHFSGLFDFDFDEGLRF